MRPISGSEIRRLFKQIPLHRLALQVCSRSANILLFMPTKTISREEPRGSSSSPSLTAKLIAAPVNRRLTRRTSPAFMPKACRCTHSSRIVFLRPTVLGWVVRGVPPDLGTSGEIVTGSASKYCRPRNPSELSWHGNYSGCEETEFRSRVLPLVLLS